MQYSYRASLILALLAFSSCQTPVGETWNHAVAKLMPDRTAEREARYGIKPSHSAQEKTNSETTYLPPKRTATPPSTVTLKPFRNSEKSPSSNVTKKEPAPSASPTPKPKKSTANPTANQTESKKNDSNISEPVAEPTPEKVSGPPPFASPVPGKKGYVTSPFSPGAGFIDVTGLEPGSEAKDPYTGKVFRVP